MGLPIGSEVGSRRWPFYGSHPDCWRTPIKGTVLAVDDPTAWAGTLAFPSESPDPEAVKAWVQTCRERGYGIDDKIPVLWEGNFVHWESADRVVPYWADLERWRNERAAAYESTTWRVRRSA